MKTDRPGDEAEALSVNPWMDGLAGRNGAGDEHAQGARIRAALAPGAQDAPAATWRDIEARARAEAAPGAEAMPADPQRPSGGARPAEAANDARPRRWLGWAAVVLLGAGLVTLVSPPGPGPDSALRGVAGQGSSGPQWLVERPAEAAEALAAELRGLQAEVSVTRDGDAVILSIRADPGSTGAVNARLAALETGLDAEGRLRLAVRPIR